MAHPPRDPNWSQEEIKIVSDFVRQSCRSELFGNSGKGKRAPANIRRIKKASWQRVAQQLVESGGPRRDWQKINVHGDEFVLSNIFLSSGVTRVLFTGGHSGCTNFSGGALNCKIRRSLCVYCRRHFQMGGTRGARASIGGARAPPCIPVVTPLVG